jgi:hypothetical protein
MKWNAIRGRGWWRGEGFPDSAVAASGLQSTILFPHFPPASNHPYNHVAESFNPVVTLLIGYFFLRKDTLPITCGDEMNYHSLFFYISRLHYCMEIVQWSFGSPIFGEKAENYES